MKSQVPRKSQLAIYEHFSSEKECRKYLLQKRWPNGFVCPACGRKGHTLRYQTHIGKEQVTKQKLWACTNKKCKKVTSLLSNTVMHNTKTPLSKWMGLVFMFTSNKQGISALRLQRLMGFKSYNTALRILRELRRSMGVAMEKQPLLRGEIQLDETSIGRSDTGGKRGKGSETLVPVMGAVEVKGDRTGRVRLQIIKTADMATVAAFALKYIDPDDSLIYTDGGTHYRILDDLGFNLYEDRVTQTDEEEDIYQDQKKEEPKTRHRAVKQLPLIHRVFSLFKRLLKATYQGSYSPKYLQAYLDEYCFRFEARHTTDLFGLAESLVEASLQVQAEPFESSTTREEPYGWLA